MNSLEQIQKYTGKLFAIREQIHRHPESGNREFHAAELVETTLHSLGIETRRMTETGIMGILEGGLPGPVAALRADMDALPVSEKTGAAFSSEVPGMMHACGHDVHTTGVLGAAMLLAERRDTLRGSVRFFFEPDEEGNGGADRMIAAGCMDGVSAVFGAHVAPDLPEGVIGVRYGKFYAASDEFTVTFHGRSAHGAQPEKGIDALAAAAEAVLEIRKLPKLLLKNPAVLNVGIFRSGHANNIISEEAVFDGIIRTLGPQDRAELKTAFREVISNICRETGTTADIDLRENYAGVVNSDEETRHVEETARALFGADAVREITVPTLTTEDFGRFIDAAKGSFYHIGAGCPAPLHNPEFLPTNNTILRLAALHADIIEHYLLK